MIARRASRVIAVTAGVSLLLATPVEATSAHPAPTGLAATVSPSSATVSWSKAKGASSYDICLQKSKTSKSCYRTVSHTTSTKTAFSRLRPTNGTDYYFRVIAHYGSVNARSALKGFNLGPTPVRPDAPTDLAHSVSPRSATITWAKASGAATYTVCLLTSSSAASCAYTSAATASTRATFADLKPTGGRDYYYRVTSHHGNLSATSVIDAFDLPVGSVTGLAAKASPGNRATLTWKLATNAGAYAVQIARDRAMNDVALNSQTSTTSYSPTKLTPGTTYYYRVQGLNDAVVGPFSGIGRLRIPSLDTHVVVVTFNLCGQDKCVTSSNGMKKWSTRKPLAGSMVRSAQPDIVATQESHNKDTRFITELPGFELAEYKSAKSLFYKTSKYTKIRFGELTLDSKLKKYAVWAELQDKVTGAHFIAVDSHVVAGKGKANDDLRARETSILIGGINNANPGHLPVIFAGDFNSNRSNADQHRYKGGYDAPLKIFTKAGAVDTFATAETLVNSIWNSANQARVTPPLKHSDHVDHIFVTPGITTNSWQVLLRLKGSQYATPFASDHNPLRVELTIPGR